MSFLKTTPTYEYTRTPLRGDFAKSACNASNDENGGPELTDIARALNSGGNFSFIIATHYNFELIALDNFKTVSVEGGKIILTIGQDVKMKLFNEETGCKNHTIEFHRSDKLATGDGAYQISKNRGPDSAKTYVIFSCASIEAVSYTHLRAHET